MLGVNVSTGGQSGAVTQSGSNGSQVGLALAVPGSAPDAYRHLDGRSRCTLNGNWVPDTRE